MILAYFMLVFLHIRASFHVLLWPSACIQRPRQAQITNETVAPRLGCSMTRLWHFPLLQGSAHFGTKHSLHIGGIASTAGQPQQLQDALVGPNKLVVTIARLM